jgi:hypothetical protein
VLPFSVRSLRLLLTGVVALFMAAGSLVALAAPARAATSGPIVGVASGRCLDVTGNSSALGTPIIIWDCHGQSNQTWTLTAAGELSVFDGTRCLDVRDFGLTAGAVVQIYSCSGGANQKWTVNANGTITGVQSGLCLDVTGAATAGGSLVETWTCNGGGNQQWRTNAQPVMPPPPAPSPTPSVASPGLFFKVPDTIRQHSRKLFAHYFGPFPISLDNAAPDSDYYATQYLKASGEGGKFAASGGYLRNRPQGRPVIQNYLATDAETDIRQAAAAGVDGFFSDVMNGSGRHWDLYMAAMAAAARLYPDGSFKVVPQIDVNGGIGSASADAVADAIWAFAQGPSAYFLPDGRFVVSAFYAEGKSLAWWQAVFSSLQSRHGIRAAFAPMYLNIGAAVNYAGQPWTYASGLWGDGADPQIQQKASNYGTAVHARGEKYVFPIQGQNIRNNQGVFDEALGTAALRAAWQRAIADGPDFVCLVTWNDYSEGGEFNNSVTRGLVNLDLTAYYAAQWKTGTAPAILQDAVYISNRDQLSTATPTGGQTRRIQHWNRPNMSPVADVVEVRTFLTAPADVTVTIAGVPVTYWAPAGETARTFPLKTGSPPSAAVARSGATVTTVASPANVLSAPVKDDAQYFQSSSVRGTTGQFDPQVKYGY